MKTNLNVLLVDDNEQMRELLMILLRHEHAHVTAVCDGRQAVERLSHARHPFDLVLSDVEMPSLDGWSLLAWVQAHDASLPVVLMSAGRPEPFVQTARAGGACGAIPKPFRQQCVHEMLLCLFHLGGQPRPPDFYCPLPAAV